MKKEATKGLILKEALRLFSSYGYDSVSVGQIAEAVGIRAPSLYNHFPSKRAIFDAIVEESLERYDEFTGKLSVHVGNSDMDTEMLSRITEDKLVVLVQRIFEYSLHDETVSRFRRMLTIEQFRSSELAGMYTGRYVERITDYHAGVFRALAAQWKLRGGDFQAMAMMYVSPVMTLIGVCDRQPEREQECMERLESHVRLFFRTFGPAE